MRGAVYVRRRQFQPDESVVVTVEQRWYAHHAFRGLQAMELRVSLPQDFRPPGRYGDGSDLEND